MRFSLKNMQKCQFFHVSRHGNKLFYTHKQCLIFVYGHYMEINNRNTTWVSEYDRITDILAGAPTLQQLVSWTLGSGWHQMSPPQWWTTHNYLPINVFIWLTDSTELCPWYKCGLRTCGVMVVCVGASVSVKLGQRDDSYL